MDGYWNTAREWTLLTHIGVTGQPFTMSTNRRYLFATVRQPNTLLRTPQFRRNARYAALGTQKALAAARASS